MSLLEQITMLWAIRTARPRTTAGESYNELPPEIRSKFESGDESQIKEALKWTMIKGNGQSDSVMEYIRDIIAPTKKD